MEKSYKINSVKLSNIKVSIKIKIDSISCKSRFMQNYSNFFVLQKKFTYIVFKKGKDNITHINITKIKSF